MPSEEILADEALDVEGRRIIRLTDHMGLIRGEIHSGMGKDGQGGWSPRFWYPDGRLTPAKPTPYDLDLSSLRFSDEAAPDEFDQTPFDDDLFGDGVPF